jgi:hypothetical protein
MGRVHAVTRAMHARAIVGLDASAMMRLPYEDWETAGDQVWVLDQPARAIYLGEGGDGLYIAEGGKYADLLFMGGGEK